MGNKKRRKFVEYQYKALGDNFPSYHHNSPSGLYEHHYNYYDTTNNTYFKLLQFYDKVATRGPKTTHGDVFTSLKLGNEFINSKFMIDTRISKDGFDCMRWIGKSGYDPSYYDNQYCIKI